MDAGVGPGAPCRHTHHTARDAVLRVQGAARQARLGPRAHGVPEREQPAVLGAAALTTCGVPRERAVRPPCFLPVVCSRRRAEGDGPALTLPSHSPSNGEAEPVCTCLVTQSQAVPVTVPSLGRPWGLSKVPLTPGPQPSCGSTPPPSSGPADLPSRGPGVCSSGKGTASGGGRLSVCERCRWEISGDR